MARGNSARQEVNVLSFEFFASIESIRGRQSANQQIIFRDMLSNSMNICILLVLLFVNTVSFKLCAADATVLDAIRRSGGLVLSAPGKTENWEVEFHLRGRDLNDEGLANVAALKRVVVLNLRDTQITSAGLVHLKGLTQLRRLHLERTKVDDKGIENLIGLDKLEYLNLYATKITDKSLDGLAGLKNLRQLYLWQTDVTDDGVAKLKKALPELKIVRGIDLSKVVPMKKPKPKPMEELKWIVASDDVKPPKSKPGSFTVLTFENKRSHRIKLYWVDYSGSLKLYGEINSGENRQQTTYSDAVWLVTDEKDKPLGYFVSGQKVALAVIPK